ncbi:MAG: hypothetical protein IJV06_07450 [Bacteroidaceae bacterium]|nr:hypothetical protein [Bacteroidaceae bacterium]
MSALFALLAAGAVLTACSSDSDTPEPVKTFYMSVDATKQVSEDMVRATRALSLDGTTLNVVWATTEHVYVQGTLVSNASKFWFKGSIQPQSAGTTTRLNGTVTLPDGWSGSIDELIGEAHYLTLQFPRSGTPDYTGQKGTLADIAEKYDYAIAANVRCDIVDGHIEGVNPAIFENQQAIVKFTFIDKADGTTRLNPTALTIKYGTETEDIELTSIPASTYATNGDGVIFVAIRGFAKQDVTLTATVGSDTYTFTKKNFTFENGQYYEINVKMKQRTTS